MHYVLPTGARRKSGNAGIPGPLARSYKRVSGHKTLSLRERFAFCLF